VAGSRAGRSRWIVIGVWLALAAAAVPLQPRLSERAADESETFLVRGSESAEAKRIIDAEFRRGSEMAAVIAYFREGGITDADGRRADADARALCRSGAIPSLTLVATPYQLACGEADPLDIGPGRSLLSSPDNSVILSSVLLTDESTPAAEQAVEAIRAVVPAADGDRTGLRAFVTGRAGFEADRSAAVKGIDETLLAVTVAVLLLLLLATYRSPVVALVPVAVVAVAYLVAAGLTYALVSAGVTNVSGQTTAMLIVLMFGAGTDYCLLLVARFRDELSRTEDIGEAMSAATSRTAPAILSAGAIVVGAMLVLAVADFNATREMGPILALGVAVMVCAGLTLLPAVLAAGALGNLGGRETLDFPESFRELPDSVRGQQVIRDHFVPGRAAPLEVVTDAEAGGDVQRALSEGPNTPVADMHAAARSVGGDLLLSEADLRMDPFSEAATDAVPVLREAAERASDAVLIGGTVAENHDTRQALRRDTALIVPLTLAVILLILAALLRAVVMPLYVIATVILSFAFALGVSSLVFTHVLGQPASDPSLPLFAFIFLVALGVDYNVFLLGRIREERRHAGTRRAVTEALGRTGGVITSAGLVLAATFSTLMALPLEPLFQIGFVVALGLLADTFLVRALLVPALAVLLGERNWWPGLLSKVR
jgi:RND superfamily putative drug exporter